MHSVNEGPSERQELEGWPENLIERKILEGILDHKTEYPINRLRNNYMKYSLHFQSHALTR